MTNRSALERVETSTVRIAGAVVELSQFPEHRQVSDSPHCLLEHVHGGDETFGKQPPQAVNVRVTNHNS